MTHPVRLIVVTTLAGLVLIGQLPAWLHCVDGHHRSHQWEAASSISGVKASSTCACSAEGSAAAGGDEDGTKPCSSEPGDGDCPGDCTLCHAFGAPNGVAVSAPAPTGSDCLGEAIIAVGSPPAAQWIASAQPRGPPSAQSPIRLAQCPPSVG
jgi:hypothetical protein